MTGPVSRSRSELSSVPCPFRDDASLVVIDHNTAAQMSSAPAQFEASHYASTAPDHHGEIRVPTGARPSGRAGVDSCRRVPRRRYVLGGALMVVGAR